MKGKFYRLSACVVLSNIIRLITGEGEICTLKSGLSTLLISIVLIVLTIVKFKFHPFLALLLASFFVGTMMGMGPLDMVNAIESGIGGTLEFLAAVIGLGTILGK